MTFGVESNWQSFQRDYTVAEAWRKSKPFQKQQKVQDAVKCQALIVWNRQAIDPGPSFSPGTLNSAVRLQSKCDERVEAVFGCLDILDKEWRSREEGNFLKCYSGSSEEKGPEKGRFWRINGICAEAGCYKWLSGKESTWNAGDTGDMCSIPGSGRSPGGRYGNPLQYSCLKNPTDRGAWQATVHSVASSQTWLSDWAGTCWGRVLLNLHLIGRMRMGTDVTCWLCFKWSHFYSRLGFLWLEHRQAQVLGPQASSGHKFEKTGSFSPLRGFQISVKISTES